MAETKIFKCTCNSPQQDALYGKQNRVFNPRQVKGGGKITGYRCTCCNRTVNEQGK